MNDQQIEQEIQAKGLTAPRVTPADIDAVIDHTNIVEFRAPSGQILRWAVLTCRNGYAVTGRPSVAVSPENDNAELGEKMAIDNARDELWPLLGYELKTTLSRATDLLTNPALTEEGREALQLAIRAGDSAAIASALSSCNALS